MFRKYMYEATAYVDQGAFKIDFTKYNPFLKDYSLVSVASADWLILDDVNKLFVIDCDKFFLAYPDCAIVTVNSFTTYTLDGMSWVSPTVGGFGSTVYFDMASVTRAFGGSPLMPSLSIFLNSPSGDPLSSIFQLKIVDDNSGSELVGTTIDVSTTSPFTSLSFNIDGNDYFFDLVQTHLGFNQPYNGDIRYVFEPCSYFSSVYGALGGSSVVDLSPLLTRLDEVLVNINGFTHLKGDAIIQHIDASIASKVDFSSVTTSLNSVETLINTSFAGIQVPELNNLHEEVASLNSQLSTVLIPLQSLNGNGCEYMDGVSVNVYGRDTVYSVSRSYMSMTDDNAYTVVYDLVSTTGAKLTVPESLLSLYVAPIVTP
ncbi:MAG: hypothetical protein Q8R86_09665 [Sulfuricurvum sp.]|nr:hypothetical protein [Sulfuricurvum sp.]